MCQLRHQARKGSTKGTIFASETSKAESVSMICSLGSVADQFSDLYDQKRGTQLDGSAKFNVISRRCSRHESMSDW